MTGISEQAITSIFNTNFKGLYATTFPDFFLLILTGMTTRLWLSYAQRLIVSLYLRFFV